MADASQPPIISVADYSVIGDPNVTGNFNIGTPNDLLVPKPGIVAGTSTGSLNFTVELDNPATFDVVQFQNLITDPRASVIISANGVTLAQTTAAPPGISLAEWVGLGRKLVVMVPETTAQQVNVSIGGSIASGAQLGYIGLNGSWQAPIGMSYDWSIEIEDLSDKQRVPFGTTYITQRPSSGVHLMILHMAFDYLRQGGPYGESDEQVFQTDGPFLLSLLVGQSIPVIGIPFPGDPVLSTLLSVTGYCNTQQQFTNPFFATWSTTFSIEQLV